MWEEREIIYLSLHCHHQNDFCIKKGRDESYSNVSVGSDGQSHKTVSTNHNFSEEGGEPKRHRTEFLPRQYQLSFEPFLCLEIVLTLAAILVLGLLLLLLFLPSKIIRTDLQSIDVGHYTEEEEKEKKMEWEDLKRAGLCTDMTLFCLIRPLTFKHRH